MTFTRPKAVDDLPTLPAPNVPVPLAQGGPDFSQPEFLAAFAQEHGPIFKRVLPNGTQPVYLLGPDANRLVFYSHREHFSHAAGWTQTLGPFFGTGLLNMDDPPWAQHRRMMNPAFTAACMAVYLPVMHRVIANQIADWADRGEVDLYEEARAIAFGVAAEALVGFSSGTEVDQLRDLFNALLHAGYDPTKVTRAQFEARMDKVERDLGDLLLPMVRTRRAVAAEHASGDVLGMMVHARDEQGAALSDEQLLSHVKILLVAGHETTTTLASWVLYLLATHPHELARVRQELAGLPGAVSPDEAPPTVEQLRALRALGYAIAEAGRLQSPVRMVPRGVLKPVEFGSYHIPAGARIRLHIAAGHRLPDLFEEPGRFDPDRFAPPREEDRKHPFALATFGGGPRVCIGMNMAQVEIKALAARVLSRYDLEPVQDHPVRQVGFIVSYPVQGIRMRVRLRVT